MKATQTREIRASVFEAGPMAQLARKKEIEMRIRASYDIHTEAFGIRWDPWPRNPWSIRRQDGRVLRRFDSVKSASDWFYQSPVATIRRAIIAQDVERALREDS